MGGAGRLAVLCEQVLGNISLAIPDNRDIETSFLLSRRSLTFVAQSKFTVSLFSLYMNTKIGKHLCLMLD